LLKESETNKLNLNVKLEKNKNKIKNNVVGKVDVILDNKVIHTEKIYLERDEKKTEKKKGFFSWLFG